MLAALTLLLLALALWFGTAATKSDSDSARAAARRDPATPATVYATVDAGAAGPTRGDGFLGLSLEYSALEAYTGADPTALDPVFVQLLRNLQPAPGEPLVLRIGGNSTDATWWPVRGVSPPASVTVRASRRPGWRRPAALASAVNAQADPGRQPGRGPSRAGRRRGSSAPGRDRIAATWPRSRSATSPTCTGCSRGTASRRRPVFAAVGALRPARVHR